MPTKDRAVQGAQGLPTQICVPESSLPIATAYNFTVLYLRPPKGQHASFLCPPTTTLQVLSTSFQRVLRQYHVSFTKSCHASTSVICEASHPTDPAVPTAGTNPSQESQVLVPQPEHSQARTAPSQRSKEGQIGSFPL